MLVRKKEGFPLAEWMASKVNELCTSVPSLAKGLRWAYGRVCDAILTAYSSSATTMRLHNINTMHVIRL
jgi:hypothetical protein